MERNNNTNTLQIGVIKVEGKGYVRQFIAITRDIVLKTPATYAYIPVIAFIMVGPILIDSNYFASDAPIALENFWQRTFRSLVLIALLLIAYMLMALTIVLQRKVEFYSDKSERIFVGIFPLKETYRHGYELTPIYTIGKTAEPDIRKFINAFFRHVKCNVKNGSPKEIYVGPSSKKWMSKYLGQKYPENLVINLDVSEFRIKGKGRAWNHKLEGWLYKRPWYLRRLWRWIFHMYIVFAVLLIPGGIGQLEIDYKLIISGIGVTLISIAIYKCHRMENELFHKLRRSELDTRQSEKFYLSGIKEIKEFCVSAIFFMILVLLWVLASLVVGQVVSSDEQSRLSTTTLPLMGTVLVFVAVSSLSKLYSAADTSIKLALLACTK